MPRLCEIFPRDNGSTSLQVFQGWYTDNAELGHSFQISQAIDFEILKRSGLDYLSFGLAKPQ